MGKKTNSDVAALKRAAKAIMASSSHRAAKAAVNYLYDVFVVHPVKETILYFANREAAQHSAQSDGFKRSPNCTCDTQLHAPWCVDFKARP